MTAENNDEIVWRKHCRICLLIKDSKEFPNYGERHNWTLKNECKTCTSNRNKAQYNKKPIGLNKIDPEKRDKVDSLIRQGLATITKISELTGVSKYIISKYKKQYLASIKENSNSS